MEFPRPAGRRALTLPPLGRPMGTCWGRGRGVTGGLRQGGAGSGLPGAQVMGMSSRAPPRGLSSGRRLPSD